MTDENQNEEQDISIEPETDDDQVSPARQDLAEGIASPLLVTVQKWQERRKK